MAGVAEFFNGLLAIYDPAEYAPYARAETGVVEGQAFLVQRAGGVVVGAGRDVYLAPVTSLSTEVYERWIIGYQRLEPTDAPVQQFTQTTKGDAEGRFRFEGLAPGDYYLWCTIQWQVPDGNITRTEGGIAHAEVSVRDGQTSRAVVTR